MVFQHAWVLVLIPVCVIALCLIRLRSGDTTFLFPDAKPLKNISGGPKIWLSRRLWYFKLAALVLILTALARPRLSLDTSARHEGIAIVLSIDCSSTMLAEDLNIGAQGLTPLVSRADDQKHVNRMNAVKKVAREFVRSRPDDLIGIVAFAAYAYVICPPTFDKNALNRSIDRLEVGLIKDATAIGSGILAAINSLKLSAAPSKVIILMTDGINNYGRVPPLVAAKVARSLGIKIYAVGIVSKGQTPFPVQDQSGHVTYKNTRIDIDEKVLKEIADTTGGVYYRVQDLRGLDETYRTIDRLERLDLEETSYENRKDVFSAPVLLALVLILLEIFAANTFLRRVP